MRWDPNQYDMVEVRIAKFYAQNEDGRIITELVPDDAEWIFKTYIYLNVGDQAAGLPKAVGHATEKKGASQFAAELTETSSVGRCLANLGMHGSKRASREEMRKVPAGNRDYIAEAEALDDVSALRLLWAEAQAAGADQKTLEQVKNRAERLSGNEGKRTGASTGVSGSGQKK
jgi:hypothetical protein|tara:strand:- start:612 stop:1130 length:519 start_codon:yes stop_codon:yes gene_type:complete